jgi:hypothetical protein
MLVVAAAAVYVSGYRPHVAGRLLGFACSAVGFVVIYSVWLANSDGIERLARDTRYESADRVMIASSRPARPTFTRPDLHGPIRLVSWPSSMR